MATITLEYSTHNSIAMQIIDEIRRSGVFRVEEKSPYNPEFVAKIERSRASEGKAIKTEDLCK